MKDLRVNSFTDAEEVAVGLEKVVPFMLETRLRELGGRFEGDERIHGARPTNRAVDTGGKASAGR